MGLQEKLRRMVWLAERVRAEARRPGIDVCVARVIDALRGVAADRKIELTQPPAAPPVVQGCYGAARLLCRETYESGFELDYDLGDRVHQLDLLVGVPPTAPAAQLALFGAVP